ncbi:angiogenic factor with G patch and FHA domains 1 isoform X1 [Bufo gargarizans]|uniref:angiogenic factor with G patch and FHA domains 1 isoform X1 n=1 Tax=Bufo gargarizans TaxID=30331 RepID=UPI001CF5CE92|nr:angiogenic factor with G patch and FHA domains 1 isoform X1 [Bufo gargarizans]
MAGHGEEVSLSPDLDEADAAIGGSGDPAPGPAETPLPSALSCRVQALEEELKHCQNELRRIQTQLSLSQRLHRTAETTNQELRTQVEKLSREIHEFQRPEKVDQEVQTDDYSAWSDYYYYQSSYEHHTHTDTHEVKASNGTESTIDTSQAGTDLQEPQEEESRLCEKDEQQTGYTQEEGGTSLAESLRATAEAALSQTGFAYDENTGMYYDHSTGFYYDSESQLYYDPSTGIYYYCDVESGRYLFHSRVDLQSFVDPNTQPSTEKKTKKKKHEPSQQDDYKASVEVRTSSSCSTAHDTVSPYDREESASRNKKPKLSKDCVDSSSRDSSSSDDSEPEEGELSDSEKTSSDEEVSSASSVSTHNSDLEDTESIWPPCIRVIVVRSPVLQKGSLYIITAEKSATIGREKNMGHAIRVAEVGVSKFHAEVYFDHSLQSYVLVDQGSQNGTIINGNQILQPKIICEPVLIHHGDEVKFGETVLSFHVHPGSDTCDGCEPGQVRAHLRLNPKEEYSALQTMLRCMLLCSLSSSAGPVLSKEEREKQRRMGLKQIREKYGLQGAGYEDNKALKNSKYKDRAGRRRKVVGSESTFQREDAPASVHVEINDSNKGRQMLEKMGWKKGDGLGKSGDGMRDPIHLQLRKKQAGLGALKSSSIEDIQVSTQNQKNWEKARERYAEHFQDAKKNDSAKATCWVKSTAH